MLKLLVKTWGQMVPFVLTSNPLLHSSLPLFLKPFHCHVSYILYSITIGGLHDKTTYSICPSLFFMLPALLIGVITMISYGVGFHIWIQNLFIWVVGISFCYGMSTKTTLKFLDISPLSITTVLIVLLVMPF